MSDSSLTAHPVVLRAPLPFSQEPWTVPPEFPAELLEELVTKRGYTRLDDDQPKRKRQKESSNGTSETHGR